MKRIVMLAVLMVLMATVLAFGATKNQEPFTVVTSEEAKEMINRQEPGLVVIDARTPEEFQEVHLSTVTPAAAAVTTPIAS